MDRFCGFFRSGVWLYCLLCVLSVTTEAATRQVVKIPPSDVVIDTGVATKGTGVTSFAVQEGEYIAADKLNRRVPIKVLKTIDYSIPRTITKVKSLLKVNLASLLLQASFAAAIAGVDWVMSDDNTKIKKKTSPGEIQPVTAHGYKIVGFTPCPSIYATGADVSACYLSYLRSADPRFTYTFTGVEYYDATHIKVNHLNHYKAGGTPDSKAFIIAERAGSCAPPLTLVEFVCIDSSKPQYEVVTDSDIDLVLSPYIQAQSAASQGLLMKGVCASSLDSFGCLDDLKVSTLTSGPSTVSGPSTTTTGTYTKPDGTIGTTSSTTNTTYNIKYGPNYFDYSTTKTITYNKDGVQTETKTETESEPVTEEEPPPEDEKEPSSPCSGKCDGPAYVDQYKKTDKTKEHELDSYSNKVKSIPIISALSNLFNVSVSSACPIWSYQGSLALMSASMPINLIFDFHCQPWFIALKPFAQGIMLLVCLFLTIRIGIL